MHVQTRDALMGGRSDIPTFVIVSAISLTLAGLVLVRTNQALPAFFVFTLPIAAIVIVNRFVRGPMRLNRELARMASLPFELDREPYLVILGERHMSIALEIVVSFAGVPPENAQVMIDRMGRAAKLRDALWIDHATVQLRGPEITTEFSGSSTHGSFVSTVGVHLWFSRKAIPLLYALHACSPIKRVTITA